MTHAEDIVGKTQDKHLEQVQVLLEETDTLIDAIEELSGARIAAVNDPMVQRNLRLLSALQNVPYEETCADFGLVTEEAHPTSGKKDKGPRRAPLKVANSEIIEAIKLGRRPTALATQFGCSKEVMASRLKRMGLGRKERRELQLLANPRVTELLDILKKMGDTKQMVGTKVARGFYTPELFGLVAELREIYDIGIEDITRDILGCSVQSFNSELSQHKKEQTEV